MTERFFAPAAALAVVLFLTAPAERASAHAQVSTIQLAPGISYTQEIDTDTPLVINVIKVDLSAPGVRIETGIAQDRVGGSDITQGREAVTRYARRHRAIAVVNGDFFPFAGDPLGIGIHGGEIFSEPWTGGDRGGPRVALGFAGSPARAHIDRLDFLGDLQAGDGARMPVRGIDRRAGKSEVVVFSGMSGLDASGPAGSVYAILTAVNLPVKANKLIVGTVSSIVPAGALSCPIPPDGLVICGGAGVGADFLSSHFRVGDKVGFALGVGAVGSAAAGVQIAALSAEDNGLPSRAATSLDRTAVAWTFVDEALGGGPRLLAGGAPAIDAANEGFDSSFVDFNHPRTAVGTSANGRYVVIVTVDGGQSLSRGVSLGELAEILRRYGATDGMNLDGGGSTAMAVAGLTVDSPGQGDGERAVADFLAVYSDQSQVAVPDWPESGQAVQGPPTIQAPRQPAAPPVDTNPVPLPSTTVAPAVQVSGPASPTSPPDSPAPVATPAAAPQFDLVPASPVVTAGQGTQIDVEVDGHRPPGSMPVIWQGPSGAGFVDQKGYFTAQRPGQASIAAIYCGQVLHTTIEVVGASPILTTADLQLAFGVDPSGASNRSLLAIHAASAAGHPYGGVVLKIAVKGGAADTAQAITDEDGDANVGITWDGKGGSAVVSGSGASATIEQAL